MRLLNLRFGKRFLPLLAVVAVLGGLAVSPVNAAAATSSTTTPTPGAHRTNAPARHPSEPLTSGPAADAPDRVASAGNAAPTVDPALATPTAPKAAPTQDWPMFLHDLGHTSASTEGILSTANASLLKAAWKAKTGNVIAAAPAVVGGVVYVGSWDGFEYALDAKTGALKWRTNLGTTTNTACHPPTIGVTSGAAVQNGVVYVGGGDRFWHALRATDGAPLWQVDTGDNTAAGGHYNWSSPVIYNGSAYIGVSSNCDNPLVQGQLLKVDLTSHVVTATANFVPNGQVGGGVWTSPAIDPGTNTVFVTTGTLNLATQPMSEALVALDAGNLATKGVWQLPRTQAGSDSDWGTSPILFTGQGKALVGAINKNGTLYAFDRNNLPAGPVWQRQTAIGGDCPTCGDGSISTGAFANGVLYFAGGNAISIGGVGYRGMVRAFNPDNGNIIWEHGTDQPVLPSIAWVNGTIVEGEGSTIEVLDAATGKSLYDYTVGGPLYAAPVVSGGSVFFGSSDSNVYSLTIGTATPAAPDPNCPAGFTCQDVGKPQKGSQSTSGGVLKVTASGAAIHGMSDQFRFLYQRTAGDVQVTTHLISQSTQNKQPQAGLMVRQSNSPDSPFYGVLEYPNNLTEKQKAPKLLIWYRTGFGANAIEANKISPAYLPEDIAIQRQGNVFTASMFVGGTWHLLPGSRQTIVMPDQVLTGIAQDSGASTNTGTATYSNTTVGAPNFTPTPAAACPTMNPAWKCQDVGTPSPVGDQSVAGGKWTLKGVGGDIGGFQDTFHYAWQTLPGDGVLTAQLTSLTNTNANAKAGIMLRQTTDPGSPYYGVFLTPANKLLVQWRVNGNLITRPSVTQTGTAPPLYLRITRYTEAGTTTYTAFTSPDGANWTAVLGSTVTVNMTGTLLAGMVADAAAPRVQNVVTFDHVSLTNGAQRPPTLCPQSWTCTDVGTATPPGGQSFDSANNSWTLLAGGPDIENTYDGFRFAYQQLAGDGTVSARVKSQAKGGIWQKSGVMLRGVNGTGVDPSAPYYGLFVTPSNGIVVQYRTQEAAFTNQIKVAGAPPVFLKVSRFTDPNTKSAQYSAYTSTDGLSWTLVPASAVTLNIAAPLQAGLAADSYTAFPATTAFDNVSVSNTGTPPPCLQGWSCADIGQPTPNGGQTLNGDGSTSVQGGGGDIWNTADQFHFVSQQVTGDQTVTAQVSSQTATDPWAKGGIMLRGTADPGSPYYAVFITPTNGVDVQYRTAQGAITNQVLLAGPKVPVYLRVVRVGTTFTAYTSPDGNTWTVVSGSIQNVAALTGNLLGGLAVTSHNTTLLSTVIFNKISLGPATLACSSGWTCADVGNPTPAGSETVNNGAWTVQGGGGDIWDVSDQFRFESQPLPGNALVSARVASQTNSNEWAKAGIMVRGTPTPGSPYYGVFLTPSHGIVVQYRTAQGVFTSAGPAITGTAPVYLAVGRNGTTFTAYTSTGGSVWTAIPTSGQTMADLGGTLQAGLAVTSHNTTVLSTVAFDNVASSPNLPAAAVGGGQAPAGTAASAPRSSSPNP